MDSTHNIFITSDWNVPLANVMSSFAGEQVDMYYGDVLNLPEKEMTLEGGEKATAKLVMSPPSYGRMPSFYEVAAALSPCRSIIAVLGPAQNDDAPLNSFMYTFQSLDRLAPLMHHANNTTSTPSSWRDRFRFRARSTTTTAAQTTKVDEAKPKHHTFNLVILLPSSDDQITEVRGYRRTQLEEQIKTLQKDFQHITLNFQESFAYFSSSSPDSTPNVSGPAFQESVKYILELERLQRISAAKEVARERKVASKKLASTSDHSTPSFWSRLLQPFRTSSAA